MIRNQYITGTVTFRCFVEEAKGVGVQSGEYRRILDRIVDLNIVDAEVGSDRQEVLRKIKEI